MINAQAFPSAHGFGKDATGGRGGTVIEVTSLANSGAGTLREALTTSGTRIIVFNVSGTITISSLISLTSTYGNFTIAGETAPGDGIQIVGTNSAYIQIDASNFIIRNIRFRGNAGTGQSTLRLYATASRTDVVVDHCSFSWANSAEMALSFGTNNVGQYHDVTISNCIFGELGRGILQYKGHYDISYYRNYHYGVYQRAPTSNYPDYQASNTLSLEVINNLYHNIFHLPVESSIGSRVTVIGNERSNAAGSTYNSGGGPELLGIGGGGEGTAGNTYVYVDDNLNEVGSIYNSGATSYIETTPYYSSDITGGLIDAVADIADMLPDIGAYTWARDSHDQRFIDYYTDDNGVEGTYTGTPDTLTGSAYTDADSDSMWDVAEIAIWGDITTTNTTTTDQDSDGYTDIEETFFYFTGETVVAETCSDGILNQDETGIDCGGVCTACPVPTILRSRMIRVGTGKGGAYLGTTKIN